MKFLARILIIIILSVIVYNGALAIIGIFDEGGVSYPAKLDKLTLSADAKAVFFRNETYVSSGSGGNIDYFVAEGQRVKKGEKIAELTSLGGSETYSAEDSPEILIDIESIMSEIEVLEAELAYNIKNNNLGEISRIKRELELRQNRIIMGGEMTPVSNEAIRSEERVSGKISFYSPMAGVVSFYSEDNYMDYAIENIPLIDYDKVLNDSYSVTSDTISRNSVVFKMVDNYSLNVVALIDPSLETGFKTGDSVQLNIEEDIVDAKVEYLFRNNDKIAMVMTVDHYFEDFQKIRVKDITIQSEAFEGIMLRRTSLLYEDDVLGVHVMELDGSEKFVPVKLKGMNEDYAICYVDYFSELSEEGDLQKVRTIQLHDEIAIEPEIIQ